MKNNKWQTIISIGAEGGSIKVLGKEQAPGKWVFSKSVNEIFYDEMDEEPSLTTREVRTFRSSNNRDSVVDSWEKALQLIERYPWPMLYPLEVHPGFRIKVWQAIQEIVNQRYKNRYGTDRFSKWERICFPGNREEIGTLATWLQQANYTTILTGAGMSTESNIPDFRSKDGWWNNIDPRTVATTDALQHHYDLFHEFYSMRMNGLKNCKPHIGHEILADWEEKGLIKAICTQNVDNLHTVAGNQNVFELHGSIHKIRCENCEKEAMQEQFLNKETCKDCGGLLRPGVVLFGENLPEKTWTDALTRIRKSDLVIVIGTSLEVYPASRLPQMTNGKTVYINAEINSSDFKFDLMIKGKAGEVLKQVNELLLNTDE